jgi:hypothetical protein
MKKIKLLILVVLLVGSASIVNAQSQWLNGSGGIYYSSGNVGINDNSPEKDFTLKGVQVVYGVGSAVMFGDDYNTTAGWGEYGIEYHNGGLNFWKPSGNSYNGGTRNYVLFLKDDGRVGIGTSVINSSYKMAVSGGLYATSIGIGTSNPNTAYKLNVNGGILAEKVKIISSVGADFVFEDDYNLPALSEVESFVKENKHLPEIQSAEEMKNGGLDMGEFQIKLLQKVEELTLYVIELEKKTARLENELNELK